MPLRNFVTQSIAGDWGIEDIKSGKVGFTRCFVIRATEFDNDFNLNLDNTRAKYRLVNNNKLTKIDIQENDLLIEKSGGSPSQPVGRVALLTSDIIQNNVIGYSNFLHKIRVNKNEISPEYLFFYLKLTHKIKLTESMQSQTNGIRNLNMHSFFSLNIIIPITLEGNYDLKKQNEIAENIKLILAKVISLQHNAENALEEARTIVTQMILGN